MSLAVKYRPKSFEEVRGNKEVIASLNSMLQDRSRFPHTILFYGQTGCGKTTLARIVADRLGCKGLDLLEINSADFRGIDTVREIIRQSQYMPLESECRVWIIDEVHKLTNDAQNAILKILEDAPSHVYFILCTTDPQKLIPTLRGRCSQFEVKPLSEQLLSGLLRRIAREEGHQLESEVLAQIIETSQGRPRNAIQILEQVLNVPPEKRLEIAKKDLENQTQIIELCRALVNGSGWNTVSRILSGLKDQEAEDIRRVVLKYCQSVLLNGKNDKAAAVLEAFLQPMYDVGFPGVVYACYSVSS